MLSNFTFGGYAKVSQELITFMNDFYQQYDIPLDPIYTGKMLFGVFDMMDKGMFSKSQKVLAIHTGGLQGIEGMNQKLRKNNLDLMV